MIDLRLSNLPLNGLRAFEAAARHLSFRDAADELAVTPAAISHQIKGLEERLGMQLFERRTRAIALTQAGLLLLPETSQGVPDAAEGPLARLSVQRDDQALTITASPSMAARWLLPPPGSAGTASSRPGDQDFGDQRCGRPGARRC